jgi:hypothetical protein
MRVNLVLRVLVVASGVIAISAMVVSALNPKAYFYYRPEERATWQFEVVPVLIVCGFAASQTAVAYFAVWFARRVRLWLSALIGFVLLLPLCLVLSQAVVHMPGFYLINLVWLLLLLSFLGLCTLISGGSHILSVVQRHRAA